jgi:hypothetical protein
MYITKVDFSRQVKQYADTLAELSGSTSVLQNFFIKTIEIDTEASTLGDVLGFNGTKYLPTKIQSFNDQILNGLIVTYNSGLTYNVSAGAYQINNVTYGYTGGTVNITSGDSAFTRFDVFYITSAQTPFVKTGTPSANPLVPSLSGGELQLGIVLVPVNFTGGTGSTIITTTAQTPFVYNATSIGGIEREPAYNSVASGNYSFAPSRNARSVGTDSVSLGYGTYASGNTEIAVGSYNEIRNDSVLNVGYGTGSGDRKTALYVTLSGETYVRKLFITNVEVVTTGSTTGNILRFNGTKYVPSTETITGSTSTGGISIFSSITNNNLVFKSFSAGTNISITDSNGIITINGGASSSGITTATTVGNGISLISSVTANNLKLYSLSGAGTTTVTLQPNGVILISSSTSGATSTGLNVGGANEVFKQVSGNQLQFRTLSGGNGVDIQQVGDIVVFTNNSVTGVTNLGGINVLSGTVVNKNIISKNIEGSGNTSVFQSGNTVYIFSPTGLTATTTSVSGTNLSVGSKVFKQKTGELLEFRTLSGGGDVRVIESGDLILISSSTITGVTNFGGISVLSGTVVNKNIISKSISGVGLTTVFENNGTIFISSATANTITGLNLGGGIEMFAQKNPSSGNLEFRTLFGGGDIRITQSGNIINITSSTVTGVTTLGGISVLSGTVVNKNIISKSISGINRSTVSESNGLIIVDSAIEVNNGAAGRLSIYRTSAPQVYSSYTANTIDSIEVLLGTHVITTGRTYTIPDVRSNADFVLTQGNQIIFGKKEFYSGLTIGPSGSTSIGNFDNIYNIFYNNRSEILYTYGNDQSANGVAILTAKNTIKKTYQLFPDEALQSTGGTTLGMYEEFDITRENGNLNDGITPISGTYIAKATNFKSRILPDRFIGSANFLSNASFEPNDTDVINHYFEFNTLSSNVGYEPHFINKYIGAAFGGFSTSQFNRPSANTYYDIYIGRMLKNNNSVTTLRIKDSAAIFVESRIKNGSDSYNPLNRQIFSGSTVAYANTPWSFFAESDRMYIGNTLVLSTGLTLSSSTRGAWLDFGRSLTNRPHIYFSAGTNVSSPVDGDLWYNGTNLYFRNGSTSLDLLAAALSTTGITGGQNTGNGIGVYVSASTNSLVFKSITGGSNVSVYQVGNTIFISAATGSVSNGITGITSAGTSVSILSGISNQNLIHKTLSAGTNVSITESNGNIIISSTGSGGSFTGVTGFTSIGGGISIPSAITSNNLSFKSLSAGTNVSITDSNGLITINSTGSSGSTSGFTNIISSGTGNVLVLSSNTNNIVQKSFSGGPNVSVYESNNTIFISATTSSGGTSSFTGVTGFTSIGGGISIPSAITSNNISFKSLSAGTNVSITDSNGLITINSTGTGSTTGITTATTVGNGISLISSVTANNLKLYSLSGFNGTNVFNIGNLIGISSDTTYYEQINYSDALNVYTSKTPTYKIGKYYQIVNRNDTGNNTYGDIILHAVSSYQLSTEGYLLGYVADYEGIGDYTDTGYNSPAIESVSFQSYNNGEIIIFNNRHYGVDSSFTLSTSGDITTNCTELVKSYSVLNGYLYKIFKIRYLIDTDTIKYMVDDKNNEVYENANINTFNFGLTNVYSNVIYNTNSLNIINCSNTSEFYGNKIEKISQINYTEIGSPIRIIDTTIIDDSFSLVNEDIDIRDGILVNKTSNISTEINLTTSSITLTFDNVFYCSEVILNTSSTNRTVTAITNSYTYQPIVTFSVLTNNTVTFKNSSIIKTEGGLDATIDGGKNDSITFKRVGSVYYQININNYL